MFGKFSFLNKTYIISLINKLSKITIEKFKISLRYLQHKQYLSCKHKENRDNISLKFKAAYEKLWKFFRRLWIFQKKNSGEH